MGKNSRVYPRYRPQSVGGPGALEPFTQCTSGVSVCWSVCVGLCVGLCVLVCVGLCVLVCVCWSVCVGLYVGVFTGPHDE